MQITWYPRLHLAIDAYPKTDQYPFVISRDYIYDNQIDKSKSVRQFAVLKNTFSTKFLKANNIHAYEVLTHNQPRRFYIDLDFKIVNTLFNSTKTDDMIKAAIDLVYDTIKKNWPDLFKKLEKEKDKLELKPIILKVPNETNKKSAHIIFPQLIFCGQETTMYFKTIINHHMNTTDNKLMQETFDMVVYKNNQSFRLPYQTNWGKTTQDGYGLELDTDKIHKDAFDAFVGIYGEQHGFTATDFEKLKEIAIKCYNQMNHTTFASSYGCLEVALSDSYVTFDAVDAVDAVDASVHCTASNASLALEYLSKIPNSNEHPQSYQIWHAVGQALKNTDSSLIGHYIKWSNLASGVYPDETAECTKKWAKMNAFGAGYRLDFLEKFSDMCASLSRKKAVAELTRAQQIDAAIQYNMDTLFNVDTSKFYMAHAATPYSEEFMKPIDLENNDIVVNEGPMGSGKTTTIIDLIKANPERFKRILIISPRKSFSKEKVAQFRAVDKFGKVACPNMLDYLDPIVQQQSNWLMFDQLAIQVESMHHLLDNVYQEDMAYDLVICDESESVISQFSSPTHQHLRNSFTAFIDTKLFTKKLILADAFISSRTVRFIEMLSDLKPARVTFETNTYNGKGDITLETIDIARIPSEIPRVKDACESHIVESIKAGKKLCVVSASKKFKDRIVNTLVRLGLLTRENILSYDRDVDNKLFNDLPNVTKTWADPNIRLVIYTTVITIGIDFSKENIFNTIYIYGSSACPIARDLIQAHHRVRHIIDKKIYCALNGCCMRSPFFTKNTLTKYHENIDSEILKYAIDPGSAMHTNIYSGSTIFNSLEEMIGYTAYVVIFMYFMKRVGYICAEFVQKPLSDATMKAAEKKMAIDLPDDYPVYYQKATELSEDAIDAIKQTIKEGNATAKEKRDVAAYYFHKHCIYSLTDLHPYESIPDIHGESKTIFKELIQQLNDGWIMNIDRTLLLEQSVNEAFINDLFRAYITDRKIKDWVDNLVTESSHVATKNLVDSRDKVLAIKEKSLMFKYVQLTCEILGLGTSYDTEAVIKDEQLEKFGDHYLKNPTMAKIFGIRLKGQSNEFKARQCVSVISSIFKKWNGFKLEVISSKNDKKGKRDANCDYVCKLTSDNIVGVYAANLNMKSTGTRRIMF